MSTTTAREVYIDFGEAIDLFQVLGQGGAVKYGMSVAGFTSGSLYAVNGLSANSGGIQTGATPITSPVARFTTVGGAGFSAILPLAFAGANVEVINAGANSMNVFPAVGDAIDQQAVNAAFAVPAGQTVSFYSANAGQWHTQVVPSSLQTQAVYNTNASAVSFTATAANISGASSEVFLGLTGAAGGAANMTLPTASALVAAIPGARAGQSYNLRVLNTANTGAWTILTATGWTLNGAMTIAATPAWTDFIVTLTSLSAVVLQRVGAGTVV